TKPEPQASLPQTPPPVPTPPPPAPPAKPEPQASLPQTPPPAAPTPPPPTPPTKPEPQASLPQTPPPAAPAPAPMPPAPPAPGNPQLAVLPPPPNLRADIDEALKGINCAAVRVRSGANGVLMLSGSVPDEQDRAKLVKIADGVPAPQRPDVKVDVIPAPLCRSVVLINSYERDGIAATGLLEARLLGEPVLHPNEAIQVEVQSLATYPVVVRIDYFTLDNQVLHMWPNPFTLNTQMGPGETRRFLHRRMDGPDPDWLVGGEPFGTELISVIATPRPLNLGANRPVIEPADSYLHDLTNALRLARAAGGASTLEATTFIHTAAQ
ncbi:MAG: hypothetical protein JO032_16525, partial [Alphaproteobacteria bacterium]|nr:hypothetical protein [Alphaproteobacteria bacterium]